jgi:hypothetical protein
MMTLRDVPELQRRTRVMEVDKVDLRMMEDDIVEIVSECIILEATLLSNMSPPGVLFDRRLHITTGSWVAFSSAYVGAIRQPPTTWGRRLRAGIYLANSHKAKLSTTQRFEKNAFDCTTS